MNWKGMQFFLHIAEVGSVTVAARELGIVQPALSRHIQRLEQEVGAELFQRFPRGVQLTDAGRIFQERCRRMVREYELARHEIGTTLNGPEGTVVFGVPGTLSPALAAPLIRRLREESPGIRLKLIDGASPYLYDGLLAGRLQAAVLTSPAAHPRIALDVIATEAFAVFSAQGPSDARLSYSIDEVVRLPLIMSSGVRRLVEDQIAASGRQLTVEAEVDSIAALRQIVLEGAGSTILPVSSLRQDVRSGQVRAYSIRDAKLHRVLAIAWPNNVVAPATQAAMSAARLEIARLSDDGALAAPSESSVLPIRAVSSRGAA